MADVIDIDVHRPHRGGHAFCEACLWPWIGVAPADVEHLECPACGSMSGRFSMDETVERSIALRILQSFDSHVGAEIADDLRVKEAKEIVRHEIEIALYQATKNIQENILKGMAARERDG